jgi:uncharacterized membrane protein
VNPHPRTHVASAAVVDSAARIGGSSLPTRPPRTALATRALSASATAWFVVAALGQLGFLVYIVGFYGSAALRGMPQDWNRVLGNGWIEGDLAGNLVVAGHLLFAAVVVLGGLVQLLPQVRTHAPRLHRWNGRVYATAALATAIGGMVMTWTRGAPGALIQDIAINLNALLVIAFAAMAVRHARARRFDAHRRWALRLFLAVSGVWFFRLMLPLWIVANQGPAGFDAETFSGPALTAIAFLSYLLPLAVLELYLRAQRAGAGARLAMAGGLGVLTLLTAAGIASAAMILWLPRL